MRYCEEWDQNIYYDYRNSSYNYTYYNTAPRISKDNKASNNLASELCIFAKSLCYSRKTGA